MNTIIIICTDPRVTLVKEALQPLLVARIIIVQDFDTGLKEVFEKRPLAVFIQDEIAGLRGETVSRHIRALLQANSPRFIPLDRAGYGSGALRTFGNGINLNLPDAELVELFREQLEQVPGIHWKESTPVPAPFEQPVAAPQTSAADEAFTFFSPELSPPTGEPHPFPPSPLPGERSPESDSLPEMSRELPSASPEPAPGNAGRDESGFEEPPFPVEPVPPRRPWRQPLLIGGGVAVLLCALLLYLSPRKAVSPSAPKPHGGTVSPQPTAPVPPKRAVTPPPLQQGARRGTMPRQKLPSFVPREGLDPAYGAVKPGWERYLSPRREYLLFRENGRIRALQVIALQKDAIDPPQVSSMLRELCGDPTCVIRSRSRQRGYLVESGTTPSGAEVLFYKKKGTGETRGVVISLP